MGTFTRLFSLLIALLPILVLANVYVHGYVRYPNGTPAVGVTVTITADSAAFQSTCQQTHYRITNSAGFYVDTLICSGTISTVRTWIISPCSNSQIIHNQIPNSNSNVESNFSICDSANNMCYSNFTWQDTNNSVVFNSSSSRGLSTVDTIISRLWTFGDGITLNGNVVNPTHVYPTPGSYSVCLKIITLFGCERTFCASVPTISSLTCYSMFRWNKSSSIQYRVLFNSSASFAVAGDSIISRKWKFGDGDSLMGNIISPEHTYPTHGIYSPCLTIKTQSGCEKTFCLSDTLFNPATNCRASFYLTNLAASTSGYSANFNSTSATLYSDSIFQYSWTFGDGTVGTGKEPTHIYTQSGIYMVCLRILSNSGCRDTICHNITIGTGHCEAIFSIDSIARPAGGNAALHYFRFNSISSHGLPVSDSIINRKWKFGDGDSLVGDIATPIHGYLNTGTYNVCLYIITASGCKDTLCKTIFIASPTNTNCQPRFATTANGFLVTFNANTSTTTAGDSIINRSWNFGDGTIISNNAPVITHQYPRAGVYQACLTIRTRSGCVSIVCKQVAVVTVSGNCVPYFTKEQIAATPKTIRFNSSDAYSQIPNDSIITRKWEFGDGQILLGNVINPLHTYLRGGTYTACLTIYTAHCDKRWCQTVQVFPMDSTSTTDSVNIVSLYPVPVTSPLNVVIHSSHANVSAQLAVYDVYGVLKSTQAVVLPFGNSDYSIPTSQLAAGPYIFKMTTVYGTKSRSFYKL